ncbi:MAG: hypothetical protein KA264_07985 [Crocinitomicaceae bacterium]|nr:hypothetical protein [Crocinitomicaceae bacterium]
MKSQVAIYESHSKAIEALEILKEAGFPMEITSLIGQAEIVDDHVHVKSSEDFKIKTTALGVAATSTLGLLAGLGIFAIPGLGFIYGAGALVGAIAGLEIGVVGSGLFSALSAIGFDKESVVKYEQHIIEGKFLVIVNGTLEQIERAEHILHTEGTHLGIESFGKEK